MKSLLLITTLIIFAFSYPNISNAEWKLYECETNYVDVFGNKVRAPCWKFRPPGNQPITLNNPSKLRGLTNIMKWKQEDRYIKFDTLDLVKIDKLDLVKVDKYENYRAYKRD